MRFLYYFNLIEFEVTSW